MLNDLLEFACRQRGEARSLASCYVARYDGDALTLACIAREDVAERGDARRAALYAEAIAILKLERHAQPA